MPKRHIRGKSAGKFSKERLKDQGEVKKFAEDYYNKHSKSVNNAINESVNNGILFPSASGDPKRVFISYIGATPSFSSKTKAKNAIEKTLKTWKGVDLQFEEAKKGRNRATFGFKDLRKLNKTKYSFETLPKDFEVYRSDGQLDWYAREYYDINKIDKTTNERIFIAKKYKYRYTYSALEGQWVRENSVPDEVWEYVKASEIGL